MTPKLLTADEAAKLAGRLAGQPAQHCSVRRLRYLLLGCGLGTDIARRTQGATRLYGIIDVAIVRLALRLEREGVSPWAVRVVLTYLRTDVIRTWRTGASVALVIKGIQGSLEPALRPRPSDALAWVPLREIWHGLDLEIQRVRDARSTVWMWRHVPVHSVPRAGT